MPKMDADCIHGYDMGDGCPICPAGKPMKPKPKAGEPFTFKMPVGLNDLTECGGVDGLNNIMDEFFWDTYGEEFMLSDISYKPVGVEGDKIIIEVYANQVESEEDDEN